MDVLAWILSAAVAATYLFAGGTKLVTPYPKLVAQDRMAWAGDFRPQQVKGIGSAEILGAIGVIVPWLTGIVPVLTPIAALGLTFLQVGAIVVHLRRGERKVVPANISLLVLALAVAVLRFSQLGAG